jgi:hypothetical protein
VAIHFGVFVTVAVFGLFGRYFIMFFRMCASGVSWYCECESDCGRQKKVFHLFFL